MTNIFYEQIHKILAPLTINGNEGEITGVGYKEGKTIYDFKDNAPEEFTKTVAIITHGYGIWNINIEKKILSRIVDLHLKIDTLRNHATLHSRHKYRGARLYINDQLVDNIVLKKPHPFGDDYGIDSRRELPILPYIDKTKCTQIIKIETDEEVSWDIDQIVLTPIIKIKIIKPWIWMLAGALISTLFGILSTCCKFCQ